MKRLTMAMVFGLLSLFTTNSQAQDMEFHHGAGFQYDYLNYEGGMFGAGAISYHPRLAMGLAREMSLSLGAPIGLGFSFGSARNYLIYSAPLAADLNFGLGSTEGSRSDFGGFLGGGYGIYGVGQAGTYSGPYAHAGLRFIYRDRPISGSLFTYQLHDEIQVYGLRVLYEITDF